MNKHDFLALLQLEADTFTQSVATPRGDWVIKGFIDVTRNIYTISTDTKVVSKVMELLLIPHLERFAQRNGLQVHLAEQQNFYPDITFIDEENHLFAVDIKTTYRINSDRTNGMTPVSYTHLTLPTSDLV